MNQAVREFLKNEDRASSKILAGISAVMVAGVLVATMAINFMG